MFGARKDHPDDDPTRLQTCSNPVLGCTWCCAATPPEPATCSASSNTSSARGARASSARAAPRSVVVAGEYPRNAPREGVYVGRLGDEGGESRSQRVGLGLQFRVGGPRVDRGGGGRGDALQGAWRGR